MLLLRRSPGVSMATKGLPSSSKRTSTLSRVVPATSLVIMRSAWASVLTNVLLPTLRRPTMATFITGSSALGRAWGASALGSRSRIMSSSFCRPRFCSVLTRISLPRPSL